MTNPKRSLVGWCRHVNRLPTFNHISALSHPLDLPSGQVALSTMRTELQHAFQNTISTGAHAQQVFGIKKHRHGNLASDPDPAADPASIHSQALGARSTVAFQRIFHVWGSLCVWIVSQQVKCWTDQHIPYTDWLYSMVFVVALRQSSYVFMF